MAKKPETQITEDDLEIVDTADQGPSEEEIVEANATAGVKAVKEKVKQTAKKGDADVIFASVNKEDSPFDVNVGMTKIHGKWDKDRQHLVFRVPHDMAEAFSRHFHVTSGRIVKVK